MSDDRYADGNQSRQRVEAHETTGESADFVLAPTDLGARSKTNANPYAARASLLERLVGEIGDPTEGLRKIAVEWFGRPRKEPVVHLVASTTGPDVVDPAGSGQAFHAELSAALDDHSALKWQRVSGPTRRRLVAAFKPDQRVRLHLGTPEDSGHRLEVYPLRGKTIERALRRVRTPTVVRVSVLVLPRRRHIPLRPANTSHAFGRLVPAGIASRDVNERVHRADAAERWQYVVRIEVGAQGEVPRHVLAAIAADIRGAGEASVGILLSGDAAAVDAEWRVAPAERSTGSRDVDWPRDMAQLNLREASCLLPLPSGLDGADLPAERLDVVPARAPRRGIVVGCAAARRPIAIGWEDLVRHIFIIGATGSGKSTCLLNVIDQLIRDPSRPAVVVLDPHGSLVELIAGCLDPSQIDRVVWFDPSDPIAPMTWNPLADSGSIDAIIAWCWEMWDPQRTMQAGMGPIAEQTLRAVLATVLTKPGSTLADALELVQDDSRARKYPLTDPTIMRFWRMRSEMSDKDKSDLVNYLTSKISPFVHDQSLRAVVSQSRSTLDLHDVVTNGRILLGSLRKAELGNETVTNLIRLLKRFLWREITGRGPGGPEQRKVIVVIDEFTNYASELDEVMLAEARKFSTGVVLATQNLGRIRDSLTESIAANVGCMLAYRTGLFDTRAVSAMLGDPSIAQELTTIANFRAVARLSAAGEPLPPFLIDSPKPLGGFSVSRLEQVRVASRARYGVRRAPEESGT